MDFSISAKMEGILAKVQDFMEQEVYPLESSMERGFKALLPEFRAKREKVKKLGFWCPQIPKDHGGMGLSLVEYGLVSGVLGRSFLGHYVFNCQAPDAGNMEILIQHGTAEQKGRYLEPLLRGDIRSCFAMTEPERAGSNPLWLDTTAVKDAKDYVINGHKWFTSGADGSQFAIVMAVTDPEAEPHERASMILVPTETPGYKLVRNIPIMGHEGEDYHSHGEVVFENCRVPRENLLGTEGSGFRIAQERLGAGRIHHCMRWIGICERSFELMCQRAAERELTPGQPLATRQTVSAVDRGQLGRDQGGAAHGFERRLEDRTGWPTGGPRGDLCDQVLCGGRLAEGARSSHPDPRRARPHQRHTSGRVPTGRARGKDLRRSR